MLRIGLTGGIGSGKTTVSDYFQSLYNIPIIDADKISHKLISPQGGAYKEVVELFGRESTLVSGEIDRKFIRQRIFETPELRDSLEQIIHPKVQHSIIKQCEKLLADYCLIVIPLLIESGMQSTVDRILIVQTEKNLQISRVMMRDECSESHVESIIDTQLSMEEKLKHADDIIINNGTHDSLITQIEQLHQKYLALSR